jgi:hypothetical protein
MQSSSQGRTPAPKDIRLREAELAKKLRELLKHEQVQSIGVRTRRANYERHPSSGQVAAPKRTCKAYANVCIRI